MQTVDKHAVNMRLLQSYNMYF